MLAATGANGAEDDHEQTERRHHFGQQTPTAAALMRRQVDRGQVEHQVGDDRTDEAARDLGVDQDDRVASRHGAERSLDQRDDRVERGRDRLQREDQRDQCAAGDDAVLQQLEPDVVRREPGGGDAGADDRGDEEGRADELGQRASGQSFGHADGAPISAARFANASVRAR